MNSDSEIEHLPANRYFILRNKRCCYCNEALTPRNNSAEHIVGRRFVPKGTLKAAWNLLLQACTECNGRKADLEDDISAISLIPPIGGPGHEDEMVHNDAIRKARGSISRYTGSPVVDSTHKIKIRADGFAGVEMTATLVAPPQIDSNRAFLLAYYQVAGFYFWVSYDEDTGIGYRWRGDFIPLLFYPRSDWGNAQSITFAQTVRDWHVRAVGTTAEGYYKIALRKCPEAELWSWAIEWNKSFRLIGFAGDSTKAQEVVSTFPKLDKKIIFDDGETQWTRRREVPLSERHEDLLFET